LQPNSLPREPRLGVGVAIVREGSLLLIRRLKAPEAGCWGLPGGKVDFGETLEAAARRETIEELGVDLGKLVFLCVTDQIHADGSAHWVAPVYLAAAVVGEPSIQEPDKHSGLGWFRFDSLPEPLTLATIQVGAVLAEWDSRQR
jgi:ADP-ribose pyrophosphatase YjhB (NUDIX family)